ncbi:MAG: type II toxin-antitoxin system RelE/ParE family toxin [Lachnospiraceae bacterium]|nr:type II toxin-antitoxin system RelE/ParE family toxin [Lachnospiraceae bacterium]
MMKYKVGLTIDALRDLDSIGDYIAYDLDNPQAAFDLTDKLEEKILRLKKYPKEHSFAPFEYAREHKVRRIIYKNYLIIYKIFE